MISEYHRPKTIEEALSLLSRQEPITLPLGGGSVLAAPSRETFAVVDLQAVGLNQIEAGGTTTLLGARVTLQALLDWAATSGEVPVRSIEALRQAVQHEARQNLRQIATLAGTLLSADGRSPLAAAFLALDASLTVLPDDEALFLADVLPLRRERLKHKLVTQISIPTQARLAYRYVARTPEDRPIVSVAAAAWPSGRTRVVVGGFGTAPRLALDGPNAEGVEVAVASALAEAGDVWASVEYRQAVGPILARRCLEDVSIA